MFKDMKMFLIDLGIIKLISMDDKISFIKYKYVNVYDTGIIDTKLNLPNGDIIKDIEFINILLEADHGMYNKKFNNYKIRPMYGTEWLSDNGHVLNNLNTMFYIWLSKYDDLHALYTKYSNDLSSGKSYSNFTRIKTYIINTEYMIDMILEYIRSKDKDI